MQTYFQHFETEFLIVMHLKLNFVFPISFQELAINLVSNGTTAQKFVQSLESRAKAGEKYSCGFTRSVKILLSV